MPVSRTAQLPFRRSVGDASVHAAATDAISSDRREPSMCATVTAVAWGRELRKVETTHARPCSLVKLHLLTRIRYNCGRTHITAISVIAQTITCGKSHIADTRFSPKLAAIMSPSFDKIKDDTSRRQSSRGCVTDQGSERRQTYSEKPTSTTPLWPQNAPAVSGSTGHSALFRTLTLCNTNWT